jgi:cobalamin biosynthesis protein CobT
MARYKGDASQNIRCMLKDNQLKIEEGILARLRASRISRRSMPSQERVMLIDASRSRMKEAKLARPQDTTASHYYNSFTTF